MRQLFLWIDTPIYHFEDTMIAGAWPLRRFMVEELLVSKGPSDVRRLIEIRVPFDLDNEGDLDDTLRGRS